MIDALIKRVSVTYKCYEMYAHRGKKVQLLVFSSQLLLTFWYINRRKIKEKEYIRVTSVECTMRVVKLQQSVIMCGLNRGVDTYLPYDHVQEFVEVDLNRK